MEWVGIIERHCSVFVSTIFAAVAVVVTWNAQYGTVKMQNHYKYINLAPTAGKGDKKTEGALIFIQYWLYVEHLTVPTKKRILDTQLSNTVLMCLFQ